MIEIVHVKFLDSVSCISDEKHRSTAKHEFLAQFD